jgi:hypothetical protein
MEIKTIVIPTSTPQKKQTKTKQESKGTGNGTSNGSGKGTGNPVFTLDGFTEVKSEYLIHLHGAWLKYIDNETKNCYSGGFLVSCDFMTSVPTITIRVPSKSELIEIQVKNKSWYIKKDAPNFLSLQDLIKEKDRVKFEKNRINMILSKIKECETCKNLLT